MLIEQRKRIQGTVGAFVMLIWTDLSGGWFEGVFLTSNDTLKALMHVYPWFMLYNSLINSHEFTMSTFNA